MIPDSSRPRKSTIHHEFINLARSDADENFALTIDLFPKVYRACLRKSAARWGACESDPERFRDHRCAVTYYQGEGRMPPPAGL